MRHFKFKHFLQQKSQPRGFALIATISIMTLLVMIALGMLSLSAIEMRASQNGRAMAEAQANARMALMIAIGRLQTEIGPDQRITAPSAILDTDSETQALEGVRYGHLTGVWNARQETLDEIPDYTREPSFRRWLVSNSDENESQSLSFATDGELLDPVDMAPGDTPDADPVRAGLITSPNGGRFAWWVGDENCKALVNPRDQLERDDSSSVAELLAGFATPGPHGLQVLTDFENFPANTPTSDKLVSRDTLDLIAPHDGDGQRFFHDISPYPQSVLASVSRGGLRRDLSLYLERSDIDWSQPWGRAEGATGPPDGPLGPNDLLCLGLGDPLYFDVLPWKTLHHWSRIHRVQMGDTKDLPINALNSTTPVPDPVSNPAWNNGNIRLSPQLVHKQVLISFGTNRIGETDEYELYLYAYPVITVWNPYNVPLKVEGWHCATASLPLINTIKKNGVKHDLDTDPNIGVKDGDFVWGWKGAAMYCNTIGGTNPTVTMAPGEARQFTHEGTGAGKRGQYGMVEAPPAWLPTKPGHRHYIGKINGEMDDNITIGTALATWETSGDILDQAALGAQMTFEVRAEPGPTHIKGDQPRMRQQMFSSQVAWRHEESNPKIDSISEWNLPNSSLKDFDGNPTPFLLLDVRLKPLDDTLLPSKNWLHNIPSLPYAAATSTAKHSTRGVDEATTFFAHPYNVSFEQVNDIEGVFQNRPFFGSSNRPGGQERIVAAPIPLAPLTSLAQLQNLPQLPMDALNWSNYYFQNLAIGNSFASPGLDPDEVQRRSFPFHLGKYLPSRGGDVAGNLYLDWRWFVNDDYTIQQAPARTVDRSYVANHLLFDDYFFSSMAAQQGSVFRQYGSERSLRDVVTDFYNGTKPLPVAAYRPYHSAGTDFSSAAAADLLMDGADPTPDAHLKAAGSLIVEGGFNINSTSVPAWTAVLSAARKKHPVSMPGGSELKDLARGSQVISRNPNPVVADTSEESRWLGYRELTDAEIRELAEAVVRQVKKRGPFRSLAEFVNRRLTTDEDLALYGAVQAALEDPAVSINADYQNLGDAMEIQAADIADTDYQFKAAALGSRYQGTPVYINQADILTPIAPIIQARSDTFVVRSYGETRSPDGTRVLARAWCEAVVQRVPEYLDPTEDASEVPQAVLKSPTNRSFGRRFVIKSFRWLSDPD